MKMMQKVLITLAAMMLMVGSAFGGSAIIGSVAGSKNASIDGQALVPNTTVFSGDSLRVKEGAAVVAVGRGSRLVFGQETVASFLREGTDVTVLLGQGNVQLYQGQAGVNLAVKVGNVTVAPTGGFKTLGEVAMVNGGVVITAREGKLRVEGNGPAVEVVKGKSITVNQKPARAPQGGAGVSAAMGLQVASVAAGGTAAVLGGIAMSKANDAKDSAAAATAAATAAEQEAKAATAAANAAGDAANAAGCALNTASDTSAYTPPAGFSCP